MDDSLSRYYRFHARIYDATRWSFLFGRKTLISRIVDLTYPDKQPRRILEVGCGTGHNIVKLSKFFPDAEITGIDLSADMLERGRKRLEKSGQGHDGNIRLERTTYGSGPPPRTGGPWDLILFSYTLSMINPGWSRVIQCAAKDLATGGLIAAVDFHNSMVRPFRTWMGVNHVKMEGHLLPEIKQYFATVVEETNLAYGGLWRYMMVIGKKV